MFNLNKEQVKKLSTWADEQEKRATEKQNLKEPYYGAIGGVYTYSFTPTSLGLIVKVKHGFTKEEIDLTDYEEW